MTMRGTRQAAGFTLVELLVALAIFMVVMGSLAVLLSGAVNTAQQGYALMNAMERARGAMSVLEADLKTAFASPEKRQYFQFYGEPNGFLFSGQLVSGGFGRVTYAVHPDNSGTQNTNGFSTVSLYLPWSSVAEQFARVLIDRNPDKNGLPNIDKDGDTNPDITIPSVDSAVTAAEQAAWSAAKPNNGFDAYADRVFTQICLQAGYPIPASGAERDYPVEFTLRIQRGVLLRYEERGQGTMTQFSDPIMTTAFASLDGQSSQVQPFGSAADSTSMLSYFPDETREKLDRLQQNHYWVRMLSGNLPLNAVVDPFLPLNPFWVEDGGTSGKYWRDYLVSEGILVGAELVVPNSEDVVMGVDSALGRGVAISVLDLSSFFFYGTETAGVSGTSFNTLWNMPAVALPSDSNVVKPMFNYFLFGPGALPVFQAYNIDPNTVLQAFGDALRVQVYGYSPGDPLKPRMPAWVAPGFWIFGDPPRSGAAPFHQWFQQKVDIPSAFLRQNPAT